jgi:hypothetical protein
VDLDATPHYANLKKKINLDYVALEGRMTGGFQIIWKESVIYNQGTITAFGWRD